MMVLTRPQMMVLRRPIIISPEERDHVLFTSGKSTALPVRKDLSIMGQASFKQPACKPFQSHGNKTLHLSPHL